VGTGLWVYVTVTSGTLTGGTINTWLECTTSRSWSKNRASIGFVSCTVQFQFARSSGGTVESTQSITLRAEGVV
jgi:hypothetical protein